MTEPVKVRAKSLLLKADKTYGIHAGRDAVLDALDRDEAGSHFAEWVVQHLEHDNLLTPDELAVYTALDSNGQVDALSATQDLSQVQGVSEEEIKLATDELRRSTDAIKKQTDALQLQNQALDRLMQKRARNDAVRKDLEEAQRRKSEIERKQLEGEIESLSYSLEHRIAENLQSDDALLPRLNTLVADCLRSDDRLLASLQKLGRELNQKDPNETETIERMKEIGLRLIKTMVETVRTKLDRVYLESLVGAAYQHHVDPPTSSEVKTLGDEVESLYLEILPVAQMSVEQQRLDPVIKSVTTRDGRSYHRSAAALDYISNCLDHLHERATSLASRTESTITCCSRSTALITRAREELSTPTEPPSQAAEPDMPGSPVRRAPTDRVRANSAISGSRRRSSGIPDIPALETLLESLGVQLPDDQSVFANRIKLLSRTARERTAKHDGVARNAQDSYEALTTSHIDDLSMAVQLLSDCALAETSYNEIKLVDPDFEDSIDLLKSEVEQARESMSRLEMKHTSKKSEKKEDMIQRWAA